MEEMKPVLSVRHLTISFTQYEKGFEKREFSTISDLNLDIHPGELVAVVGSSGSGKSLLAHGILGILPYNARMGGELFFEGEPLTKERAKALRGKEIVLVPQSVSYLDPLMKVGPQIRKGRKEKTLRERTAAVLSRYGLSRDTESMYPFQLSGGMARRVLISTAVMETPKLIIADEPTPGLHATAARRVLGHFRELAEEGAGVLFITHDLELAIEAADRIVVFYAGTTVENALVSAFEQEETLLHPYTKALWRAMPKNGFQWIPGSQPYSKELPKGCPFRPRCDRAEKDCEEAVLSQRVGNTVVRCNHPGKESV